MWSAIILVPLFYSKYFDNKVIKFIFVIISKTVSINNKCFSYLIDFTVSIVF